MEVGKCLKKVKLDDPLENEIDMTHCQVSHSKYFLKKEPLTWYTAAELVWISTHNFIIDSVFHGSQDDDRANIVDWKDKNKNSYNKLKVNLLFWTSTVS